MTYPTPPVRNIGFNSSYLRRSGWEGTPAEQQAAALRAKTAAMPIDEAGQISIQQALAQRNTFMDQLRQQRQAEEANYWDTRHDINQQHPIDVRNLLDNYAGRGMAFSSGYGDATNQLADTYSTNLARLAAARAQALAGFTTSRQDYNQQFGTDEAAIRQAAADRLSSSAGTLGLGKSTNPKTQAKQLQGN